MNEIFNDPDTSNFRLFFEDIKGLILNWNIPLESKQYTKNYYLNGNEIGRLHQII